MALGRRCDPGCESWPHNDRYKVCPVCGEETTLFRNLSPLSDEEAAHREFELFYNTWDSERPGSRLLGDAPNAAGRFASSPRLIAASALTHREDDLSASS